MIQLILHELRRITPVRLHIALPVTEPLGALCCAYLVAPSARTANEDWAQEYAMSERTLDRRFREATGLSPAARRPVRVCRGACRCCGGLP